MQDSEGVDHMAASHIHIAMVRSCVSVRWRREMRAARRNKPVVTSLASSRPLCLVIALAAAPKTGSYDGRSWRTDVDGTVVRIDQAPRLHASISDVFDDASAMRCIRTVLSLVASGTFGCRGLECGVVCGVVRAVKKNEQLRLGGAEGLVT